MGREAGCRCIDDGSRGARDSGLSDVIYRARHRLRRGLRECWTATENQEGRDHKPCVYVLVHGVSSYGGWVGFDPRVSIACFGLSWVTLPTQNHYTSVIIPSAANGDRD